MGEFHQLKDSLCNEKNSCPVNLNYYTFFSLLKRKAVEGFSDLFHREPLADGGGLEFILRPYTLRDLVRQRNRIRALLAFSRSYKLYPSDKDGIHVNVDYHLLGSNLETQRETLGRLLKFLSPLSDAYSFCQRMCGRQHEASKLSDVYTFLNDPFRRMSTDVLEKTFRETQKEILAALGSEPMCALNMCFGKEGRQCVEWRWFASTNETKRLYEIVFFVHSVIIFARESRTELTLAQYKRFTKSPSYLWLKILLLLG